MVKVGIAGFNALTRTLLRVFISKLTQTCPPQENLFHIVSINCPKTSIECMVYMLKHDPIYGDPKVEISHNLDEISIGGIRIAVTNCEEQAAPWKNTKTEYVIDVINGTNDKSGMHLRDGVKKVFVAGNGTGRYPVHVFGVNHECIKDRADLIVMGSQHINAVACIASILHEPYILQEVVTSYLVPSGIESGVEKPCNKTFCKDLVPLENAFTPATSPGRGKFVSKIYPDLCDKIHSAAFQTSIPMIGGVQFLGRLCTNTTKEDIICKIKEASEGLLKGILSTSEDIRSTDALATEYSCIVDLKTVQYKKKGNIVHLFGIYDCGYAYATRIFDLANFVAYREQLQNKQCHN
ncbi:unnamed protein product [Brassicogethes aeneus]|uniref:Glyceraldehyde 3-phosphate dehydrogenase NAD(P) binding domain-containing protein n=1 Tax=Brassicogethes aeneus TaxID=1431903 RepID=A0A9P0BJE4_BRAAE|nr:unnamed protein product [Brassicogethes aeneus]